MKTHSIQILLIIAAFGLSSVAISQTIIEDYDNKKEGFYRIGSDDEDLLEFIQKGYTLSLPDDKPIKGVIIFFEGSGFDAKNKSASQLYGEANQNGFAVLSVSTEIPLDFFFSTESRQVAHDTIQRAFLKNSLPNENVFLIGVGLSGHRALKYVQFVKESQNLFNLDIAGLVICDAPLDWIRQYNEGKRDIRINFDEGAVWEGTFATYLLENNLGGSPKTNFEEYAEFSAYSYFDEENRNINYFKEYPMRTYMEIAIQYWLEKKRKTLFDNNGPDMVGLIAQMKLAGNKESDLVVIYPNESNEVKKNPDATWKAVDKDDLINWLIENSKV